MLAKLTIFEPGLEPRTGVLSTNGCRLGNGAQDEIVLQSLPKNQALSIRFLYHQGSRQWTVYAIDQTACAYVSEELIESEAPGRTLAPGDQIQFMSARVRFDLEWDSPVLDGHRLSEIPLRAGTTYTMGRNSQEQESAAGKILLDPDDYRISSTHLIIDWDQGTPKVKDVSKLGSTLNGEAFSESKLVYGDRIQIADYVFEYNGRALKWLNLRNMGRIEAKDLVRTAGGRRILDGISVTIEPGEFIGILGGSGQGKSTLLNALCGIVPADMGCVRISGSEIKDRASLRKTGIGYVPQDDIVHRELTVDKALLYAGMLRLKLPKKEIQARIERVIAQLGLADHRQKRVYMLSGGQRKRVSIAIELLSNPSVLFLDEPSSGLDPATEENLMALLQQLALSGKTIVCTTHVLQKAYLFDKLLFVHGGKLVFAGSSDQAREHFLGGSAATHDSTEAPLEKIYGILANGRQSAQQMEESYHKSAFHTTPEPVVTDQEAASLQGAPRVSSLLACIVLLMRQWSILAADKLNLAFLAAQAVAIAFLVAWVSEDIGMRMFLCIIASMWFGCSNAAQQICGEIMVFKRERVSGLGLQTYYIAKFLFLGALTSAQTLLLLFVMISCSHWLHPEDWDAEQFATNLQERVTTVAGVEEPQAEMAEEFAVVGDDEDLPPEPEAGPTAPAPVQAPATPKQLTAGQIKRFAALAKVFHIDANLVDSGPRDVLLPDGNRLRRRDGSLVVYPGLPLNQVLGFTLGLRLGGVLIAGLVGVALGLAVSSLVRNNTQAMMWVPLILIPQILFGGFVVPYSEMTSSARYFSKFIPSFSAQNIIDVSHVYGRSTPFISNRTKTPVFLTKNADKEEVTWNTGGRDYRQEYDKVSSFNRSFQNLLVIPERLGQHKQLTTEVHGTTTTIINDIAEKRHDVIYTKGIIFDTTQPATDSLMRLLAWLVFCYALTNFGLISKQSGT